jgi:hypothetical protein
MAEAAYDRAAFFAFDVFIELTQALSKIVNAARFDGQWSR